MTPTLHRGWVITPNGRKGGGAWVMTPPPERNELGTTAVEGFEKEIIEKKSLLGFACLVGLPVSFAFFFLFSFVVGGVQRGVINKGSYFEYFMMKKESPEREIRPAG